MSTPQDVVIVGASLAGLRTAEALREGGYEGRLTLIGDENHPPYDRPPLSKQVLSGWVKPNETTLPRVRPSHAAWRLGVAATRLDRPRNFVETATGEQVGFDRLVIATGSRARAWPDPIGRALAGVYTLRTPEDAAGLVGALDARPRRVLVIGAGFTGSEVASACRSRGLPVTVIEIGATPLCGALGRVVGDHAARLQRDAGVDLRCGVAVTDLMDDGAGRVAAARLSDGELIETEVVVVCLGAERNWDWLAGAGLNAGPKGCVCTSGCEALDEADAIVPEIFVCGDIARFTHPLSDGRLVSLEHWGNAVDQARVVAANLLSPGSANHNGSLPRFWSMQFGTNFKATGLPSQADAVMIVQGSMESGRFIAIYGRGDRTVGVVSVNQAQWLSFYEQQLADAASFPPTYRVVDPPAAHDPQPAGFPVLA